VRRRDFGDFGLKPNTEAHERLTAGAGVLEAVQRGVMVAEADPEVNSVGYGGYPNIEGVVELDAAIMDGRSLDAGSVAGIRDIMHPVAVARKVMEETPHILLVGDGAKRFALAHGFEAQNLLTEQARNAWEEELGAIEEDSAVGHDTIGMIALAEDGRMAAACTTSGLAWKLPGRVGDSPLIGHGVYCDERAGAAVATGVGEDVIRVCGSYQVVEFMRQGMEPETAARRVLQRILDRPGAQLDHQVGLIAVRADGRVGYASLNPGFQVTLSQDQRTEVLDAPALLQSTE